MLYERDATRLWQQLFHGQTVTSQILTEAEKLVDDLPAESPLRSRLTTELDEIRSLHQGIQPKRRR
jgi:hypothetical protein